jgi:hypothetical protein
MNIGFSKIDVWNTSVSSAGASTYRTTSIDTTTTWNTSVSTTTSYNTSRSTATAVGSNWSTSHSTTTTWVTNISTTTSYNTSVSTTTTWQTSRSTDYYTAWYTNASRSTTTTWSTSGVVQTGYISYWASAINTSAATTTSWSTSWNTAFITAGLTNKLMATLWMTYWNTGVSTLGPDHNTNTKVQTSTITDDGLGCFVKGTRINITLTETILIEDLFKGDDILSMDCVFNTDDLINLVTLSTNILNGDKVINQVLNIRESYARGVALINEGEFKTTFDHMHIFKRDGIWKCAQALELLVGDVFYGIDGNEIVIYEIIYDEITDYTVYKLDVEPLDVYFANGILTHNAKIEEQF